MTEDQFEWSDVEPGGVTIGSDRRSVIFGGMGPRHQVHIRYNFKISKTLIEAKQASRIIRETSAEKASESEWELAHSRGLVSGEEGEVELLADSASNYWGKVCDGRPHFGDKGSPKISRKWQRGKPKTTILFSDMPDLEAKVRLVIRDECDWDGGNPSLPSKADSSRILLEEALISLFFGIIPSFGWAYFNASPGYIMEGWLNLLFGGIFFGVFTIIFWRPKQPTWKIEGDKMVRKI